MPAERTGVSCAAGARALLRKPEAAADDDKVRLTCCSLLLASCILIALVKHAPVNPCRRLQGPA
jgi:hypothetical protein